MGIFTRYKDGRIDVVPHAVLQIFAKFQSQVGKILIIAINIIVKARLELGRLKDAHCNCSAESRPRPHPSARLSKMS